MADQTNQKFRPYFSPAELTEIIGWGKKCAGSSSLIRYLETFAIKIERGTMSPQLELVPSMEDKLELGDGPTVANKVQDKKLAAYNKWITKPVACSSQDIALSKMYRYENDLMDSEEESAYEKANGLGA